MAAFATATSPRTEYAVVRALSTSDALHRRAPTTEATAPYAASERAMASETVPTNAATSADHGRGWRFARGGWSVLLAVLDQHGVRVKRTVGAERALEDDADAGSEQRGGAASMDDGHPGRSVGDDEVDAVTALVNRARDNLAAETKTLARRGMLLQQLGRRHVVDEVAREPARSDPRQAPGDQDEQDNDPRAHTSDSIAGFGDPSRQRAGPVPPRARPRCDAAQMTMRTARGAPSASASYSRHAEASRTTPSRIASGSRTNGRRIRSENFPSTDVMGPGTTVTPCRVAACANDVASPTGIRTHRHSPPSGGSHVHPGSHSPSSPSSMAFRSRTVSRRRSRMTSRSSIRWSATIW